MTDINLKDYDIFVDFGKGDKFLLSDFIIDENNKKIIFKGSQGSLGWVRLDTLYPAVIPK